MKKSLVFLSIITVIASCSSLKEKPFLYELYDKDIVQPGVSKKNEIFWLYSFKNIATLSYFNTLSGTETFKYKPTEGLSKFTNEYRILGKYANIADSIGKTNALARPIKFVNFLHFQSSAYLDSAAKANFKIVKNTPLSEETKKIIRESKKEEH